MKAEEYLNNICNTDDIYPTAFLNVSECIEHCKSYGDLRASEAVEDYKQSLISVDIANHADNMGVIDLTIHGTKTYVVLEQEQLKGMVCVGKAVEVFKHLADRSHYPSEDICAFENILTKE